MSNDESDHFLPTQRDWGSIRDWMNVLAAIGALFVGIVSLWTTAQISGLEDYFRSEIKRRNSDLDTLAAQSRRLNMLADERSTELAKLQTTTDAITASNLAAQGRLVATQQELSKVGLEVVASKQAIAIAETRLAQLGQQSGEQQDLIDRYRRQRLFQIANRVVLYRTLFREEGEQPGSPGERLYRLVTTWPLEIDSELAPYVSELTSNTRRTCEWVRSYNPDLPKNLSYPTGPRIAGTLSGDGKSRLMSKREYEQWTTDLEAWNKEWAVVSEHNRRALEVSQEAQRYLTEAGAHCVCQALVNSKNPASAICPGYEKRPERKASVTK
jgi:hypothetical protein